MIPPGESFLERFRGVVGSDEFEKKSPEDRINAVLAIRAPQDVRFLSHFMEKEVKLHSFRQMSSKASFTVFRFKVDRFYCNASDNLHGGAQASIFDMLTSIALQSTGTPGFWLNAGVSRSLNCTYLRPAPMNVVLLCEIEVVSAGKSLALLRGVLRREDNGAVISTCEHDKAAVLAKPGFNPPKL